MKLELLSWVNLSLVQHITELFIVTEVYNPSWMETSFIESVFRQVAIVITKGSWSKCVVTLNPNPYKANLHHDNERLCL